MKFIYGPEVKFLPFVVTIMAIFLLLTGCYTIPSRSDGGSFETLQRGKIHEDDILEFAGCLLDGFSTAGAQLAHDGVRQQQSKEGYRVVNHAGPDIVGIRFTLTDVNAGNPYLNVLQFHPYGAAPDIGGITIESEFYDTTNSQVNAIAIVGAEGARKFNLSAVKGRWGDVKRIFDDWTEGFRGRVDDAHVSEDSAY